MNEIDPFELLARSSSMWLLRATLTGFFAMRDSARVDRSKDDLARATEPVRTPRPDTCVRFLFREPVVRHALLTLMHDDAVSYSIGCRRSGSFG